MGLILDQYRGIPRVQHTGEWVGYRASFLRFPLQKLSVIVLCNMLGELDPLALSERVADIYLGVGERIPTERDSRPAPTASELASYGGTYWNPETFAYLRFTAADGTLALENGDSAQKLSYAGHGEFLAQNSTARYAFHRTAAGITVDAVDDDSDPIVLERMPARVREDDLLAYAGTYYNDELGASWTLEIRGTQLIRAQWMFPAQTLKPILPDTFTGDLSEGTYALRFTRNEAGQVDGFEVGTTMVRPLRFSRCQPAAPLDGGPIQLGCDLKQLSLSIVGHE
jgi:hypothetical protein